MTPLNVEAGHEMIYVLYHASCADGFGAALAAWTVLRDSAIYIPVQYGQALPDIPDNSTVYILDFSYDRVTLEALSRRVAKLIVLDHHKTAEAELVGLPFAIFDMGKSGAVLAWNYFHPDEIVPTLFEYIQDRDLWQWKLPNSRAFSAMLSIVPRSFETWESLLLGDVDFTTFIEQGSAILAAQFIQVASLASKAFLTNVGGYMVPVINSSLFQSEIGEELCKRYPESPFAAIFFVPEPGIEIWSLRSRNGFDVSVVAKKFEGGGHMAAAGFRRTHVGAAVDVDFDFAK